MDAPCGIRLETPDTDLLFYEEATSPLHQNHILAHEISHIVCDHPGSLELDQDTLRAIGFDPTLVRRMSGRTSYTSEDEREAEVMASVIRQLMYRGRESAEPDRRRRRELGRAVRRAAQEETPPKMINIVFTGTAVVLLCFAAYWVRGRGGHRPTGTWAMAALLTSFALAFASYAPARLLSNTFPLTAAASVLAFLFQLNLERERARRQIRLRVIALAISVALVSIGLGLGLVPDHARCSTPLTPFRCTFSVTAPAVGVLLITAGLTLPALLWPLSPLRRRRWERNPFTALEPLWREVTSAAAAEAALRGTAGTPGGDAEVEAAVIAAAVEAKRAGLPLDGEEAPPAAGTRSRKGDLPAETAWLLLVAEAHARRPAPEHAGAAS
ncbi:DUF6545 domain-containing protein [Streptomyces goshikiensis]|uniref:DUF6545 domain-containing protein n=1 Tax=Streptomyces goshikiensis TaxID=1942 RepID=UPI00365E874B